MRLFFAVWPPRDTARALAGWAGEAAAVTAGKATPEEKIHLTLAFLGSAEPAPAIAAAKGVKAGGFELAVDSAKYWRGNHIVWAGPREMPAGLKTLVERLHDALLHADFVLERRPFAAHVTLVRKAQRPRALPALPVVRWPVSEFALVSSVQASYKDVARFRLE